MTDKFDDTDAVWSALLDGQENGQAARFLLNRVERDEVLRQRWSRWHYIVRSSMLSLWEPFRA